MSRSSRFRRELRGRPDRKLVSVIMLFFFSAFLLIACRGELHWQGFMLAAVVPLLIYIATMWLPRFFPADKLLLSIANFLCALGVLVLYSTDLIKGTNYGMQQAVYYGAGILSMLFCILLVRYIRYWRVFIYIIAMCAVGLIVLPLLFGTEIYGATNWIIISGVSLQPSEIVKIALLLVLSYFMSQKRFWPWLVFSVLCMGVLMFQRDLGTALIYYMTALLLYYASTGNLWITGAGLLGGAGSAVFGYYEFAHVKRRIAVWHNPWMDFENTGYQIAQMLMAIASGGLLGVGLGLGAPTIIPVYHTDAIFAVICEQFGIIFGVLVLVMYIILILRGAAIARSARRSFHGLLAMGVTVMLALQTFVIIGGVLKLIPLTGVTMPFVSYGGTSLVSCMGLIGLLQGVSSVNQDDLTYDYEVSHSRIDEEELPFADSDR
ncbi:MAG: FtsW/RodA/SpoVE family cell cycle protein [Bacillota bacterium]